MPTVAHERRRQVLQDLGRLAGYLEAPEPAELPGGGLPDVLRADLRRRRLFVADAKEAETPGNAATRARMERYVRSALAAVGIGADVTLAICAGRAHEAWRWQDDLRRAVAGRAGIMDSGVVTLGDDYLSWVTLSRTSTGNSSRAGQTLATAQASHRGRTA